MKVFSKIAVILFNLCLILSVGITAALLIASSPSYYRQQFEKNGIYSDKSGEDEKRHRIYYVGGDAKISATFSDEQYDIMIDHVIDFLFGDTESFELTLDGVDVWGVGLCDGVSVFGEQAVSHMADVKTLIKTVKVIGIATTALTIMLVAFFIIKRRDCSQFLLRYTAYFYIALLIFAAGFCIWSLISALIQKTTFLYMLWGNVHYLLFPFQPEKYEESFLADTLPQILSLELFITALVIVFAAIAVAVALWLAGAHFIKKHSEFTKAS